MRMSEISLDKYNELAENLWSNISEGERSPCSNILLDHEFQVIGNENGDETNEKYPVVENFHKKMTHYCDLKNKFNLNENMKAKERLQSLIVTGLKTIEKLEFKLNYLNKNFKYLDDYSLQLHHEKTLTIDRSVQKEFVELLQILAELCNTLDENLNFLSNEVGVDWESLTKKMEKTVADKKVMLTLLIRYSVDIKRLKSSVEIATGQNVNSPVIQ
ncbi:uncharacterized protein LOC142331203 [Lycorma delicatula]|uniref:uncharacterized protein LOC142331203 n=1 Tax=Lycorma delicatula TaxID=130591 RepID=UPI003F513A38